MCGASLITHCMQAKICPCPCCSTQGPPKQPTHVLLFIHPLTPCTHRPRTLRMTSCTCPHGMCAPCGKQVVMMSLGPVHKQCAAPKCPFCQQTIKGFALSTTLPVLRTLQSHMGAAAAAAAVAAANGSSVPVTTNTELVAVA